MVAAGCPVQSYSQTGGYDWRINQEGLAAFQDIFGVVDITQRYQYGSVDWTIQGGMCWLP